MMKKKCICKNCEDCKLYLPWDMTNDKTGLRKQVHRCGLQVLFEEIPRLRGAIDGCQQGANEARNRSVETKEMVNRLGMATQEAFEQLGQRVELIGE